MDKTSTVSPAVQTEDEVAVIGGGPAGLMAADVLSAAGCGVTIYDRMPTLGRKFLMAGRGGLNLTHSEDRAAFLERYGAAAGALTPHIDAFPPGALARWCEDLGPATFVGSSGRVFPSSFKTSPLLRAWLERLDGRGVRFAARHTWLGWDASGLRFETSAGEPVHRSPRATVLAIGGASWPRLGADGGWVAKVRAAGIEVRDLQAANTGCEIAWSPFVRSKFAGAPLKRIAATVDGVTALGEAIVTSAGLEGGAIYALTPHLRARLAAGKSCTITLDLRPDVSLDRLIYRLQRSRGKQSATNFLRKASGLSPAAIGLLREGQSSAAEATQPLPSSPELLAARIKALTLPVHGLGGLARAISSAGGIAWAAVDDRLMLRAKSGVFVAGEMLDWEAPTGGYLLQACFSTGRAAALGVLHWLGRPPAETVNPPWHVPQTAPPPANANG